MRHSRRAYEDRNETDYVLHRIHGLARQISRASGAIRQHRVDRADLGRLDQPRMRHGDRVQRAFQSLQPEIKELVERRKCRAQIVPLPDIALQQPG